MIDLLYSLWQNIDWIGAILSGGGAAIAFLRSARLVGYILAGAALVLSLLAAVSAARGVLIQKEADGYARCNAHWTGEMARINAEAAKRERDKIDAAYAAGVKAASAREEANTKDQQTAIDAVKEAKSESQSARECVFDRSAADALNKLRIEE